MQSGGIYFKIAIRGLAHLRKSNIASRFPPFEVFPSLQEEFTKSIQEPKLRKLFLDPEECSCFIDFEEYIFSSRSHDYVETAENNPEITHNTPTGGSNFSW